MTSSLRPFFAPKGVALIGASDNPSKLSHGILKNMVSYGYQGAVYPVNPKSTRILGLTCYPDIRQVPDPVDLAVIIIPAPLVPDALEACGERGIRAAIIISGGFKEVGPEGADLEKHCLEIARKHYMRLIGPNCVGTLDLYTGLNTTFIQGVPARGGISFVSQSGAVGGGVIDYLRDKGVGFSAFASLGNEADVTETDLIEYFAVDPNTRVITAYVESIRDGQRFLHVAREVTRYKPIVMLKAGRTEAGARAVSSHTGSLAGANEAYHAAFVQSGVIEAQTVAELFEIAVALDTQPLPQGRRIALITNAGGPAALASDSLAAHGLTLATLSATTRQTLREHLNPAAQVDNPVDMLGGAEPQDYAFALTHTLQDPNVDAVFTILVPQALVNPAEVAQRIVQTAQAQADKPVLACFMGEYSVGQAREVLHHGRIPMYTFPESAGYVLEAMANYAQWRQKSLLTPQRPQDCQPQEVKRLLKAQGERLVWGEFETRPILDAYGIPLIPGDLARSSQEAVQIAERLGYPVVLKIVSPHILHKSDVGGIRLNLNNAEDVRAAFSEMMAHIRARLPQAELVGALVEPMAPQGYEVIIGMRRDPNFGPLMMFGLGGIYVELFRDVSFRIAPLTRGDALQMINETHAGRLLAGFRGQPEADLDALVDILLRFSHLAVDFPALQEAEINPLLVRPKGQGALVLDCRIVLDENKNYNNP
ncbi:acetate--CoA ligase family protein [Thermanaerothrix sp. 4228-RoL]|uniref:Acetate--CoA ligase family protein n=1 Tax=Thermanaerothrix solaris TaxID=3058434 RepID=A0ABU3NQZ7_9CHLR|nr:acetate--CoA ligase family protein [Thermanaerothrix sp. 4228-RoL]MDT8899214.1 acetate--CoA ligase family protein [Thermanaerothrix sp. 4228-RoL]